MAITVNVTPAGGRPVYNDIIYVVESDKTAQPNFKYICDIYINNAVTKTHRMSVPAHPTLGVGVFNPSRILESYISGNFDLSLTGITQCSDSIGVFQLKFGEEYGLSSSGTTVYADLSTTSNKMFWNGVFDWEGFCDYDDTLYRSEDSGSRFLTNSPSGKKVFLDENEYLYAINRVSGDIYYFNIDTYDSNGLLNGSFKIENSYQAMTNVADRMVRCPAGWNLNDITSGVTVVAGSLPILKSTVGSYDIKCINFAGTTTIGFKNFVLDTSCERYTKYRLHFLNKLGGYDSFSFTKKSKITSDIKRENFKSNLGELTSISAYTHSKSQRATTQYSTNIEDTIKVTSDWLSSGDVAWLEELVTSPDVYVEKNGAIVPINITTSSFDMQNGEDKKLFNLSIDFKYSYKRYRQRF